MQWKSLRMWEFNHLCEGPKLQVFIKRFKYLAKQRYFKYSNLWIVLVIIIIITVIF